MSTIAQINPFNYFSDLNGFALDGGYIYIGLPNRDPRQFPATIYLDSGLTIPAQQPLRTTAGYVTRNNSPAFLYINGNYSVMVRNQKDEQVYYVADFLLTGNSGAVSISDLSNTTNPLLGAAIVGRMPLQIETVAELRLTPGRFVNDRAQLMNYLANDKKGRGRYLTWVPGATTDDGGMKFSATGGTWLSDLNADGRVDTEFYGLPLAAGVSCFAQDQAIEAYCFANKVSAWYGVGPDTSAFPPRYNYGTNNWNWSGIRTAGNALKDYKGVRIYSTPEVTFETISVVGADVMQCCGIQNFGVIGYPTVTATLNNGGGDPGVGFSGSNALSLVFGCVDCVFELNVNGMPGIYRLSGAIDGGQAFSIQPGTGNTNPYNNVVLRGTANNCTQGFGCDFNLDDMVLHPLQGIQIDLDIKNCYRGISIGGAAATVAHSTKACTDISGSARIQDCQQAYVNFRSIGTNLKVSVVNTKDVAALIKNVNSPAVVTTNILGAKQGSLDIRGRILSTDVHLQIGGTSMGGGDVGSTENFNLVHDVSLNSATTAVMSVVNFGGNSVDKSVISVFGILTGFQAINTDGSNTLIVNGATTIPTIYPGDTNVTALRVPLYKAIFSVPLTAVRAVTFTSAAVIGDVVRVVRLAAATGGGVSVGGLVNILPGTWAEATFSGSVWNITGQGSL
jgi:hypothetical protein